MAELTLIEQRHPDRAAEEMYNSLVAIDDLKQSLLMNLELLFQKTKFAEWQKQHHPSGLDVLSHVSKISPLIILSGEVGCGKTALANSIGTPLSTRLNHRKVITLETPSDIRGSGMVGELSNRVSAAFKAAKAKVPKESYGLLIIDEADDLATSRSQNQAHHEDRAGLNVLIKEIDQLARERDNLAVILITNRIDVLDPAIRRRTALHLNFERPSGERLTTVFEYIFSQVNHEPSQILDLVKQAKKSKIPYSFSDLLQRALRLAIIKSVDNGSPLSISVYAEILNDLVPSPLLEEITIQQLK
jgi:SpoVK/Ycf46/Vps4 family AAA+-type ATPase